MTGTRPTAGHSTVTQSWRREARAARPRVVLADGEDKRAAEAARRLDAEGLAVAILLDEPAAFASPAVQAAARASPYVERIDLGDPLHVAALMVAAGEAEACVAGATRPTPEVVRAALYCIGPAPGVEIISSCFLLVLPGGTPITFGDCGVVPEPDAEQLASIAISSAATHEALVGERARVAMLSYSTKGSAAGPRVERVRAATEIVRRRAPSLATDGELQFDAAWAPEVARRKAPGSAVAGEANVFVFPDLDSGNIAYKITERLGGARAYGPLLQGTAGVMHDLSRGCDVDDIVAVAVIAACQAARSTALTSNDCDIPDSFHVMDPPGSGAEAGGRSQ
ncbi:MAG: recombinase [Acidimicrobiia bacterium]|nr:recombinase [Acidimicrobiia bacterium]